MSNDWDELFAMAEGAGDAEKEEQAPENEEMSSRSKKKKKSRKRKRKEKDSLSHQYQEAMQEILKARMNVPGESPVWPGWLSIGGAFSTGTDSQCSQFKSSRTEDNGTLCCQNCQHSALHHIIHTTENHPCLHVFCNIRNLRAMAKVLVVQPKTIRKSKHFVKTIQDQLHQMKRTVSSQLIREVPAHESSLLESKVLSISKYAHQAIAEMSSTKKSDAYAPSAIDDLVRLIIACDDLYYRVYYLQITSQLPPMALNAFENDDDDDDEKEGSSGFVFLPHPPEYFGLPHLVADHEMESEWCQNFLASLHEEGGGDSHLLESFSLRVGCHFAADNDGTDLFNKLHPLAAIRRFRFLETVALFHKTGWYESLDTQNKVVKALNLGSGDTDDENGEEETPAPSLLSEWRDSCRDFLCHLYAYATLSEKSLTAIANFAKGGIVEYGAGTGYLAFCLANRYKVNVTAYDVCPTPEEGSLPGDSSLNDYHGQTPCFCKVQKGDLATLSRDLKVNDLVAREKTLLLCYPPPKTSMAYDILRAFAEHGGTTFIHIGEFRGLTGDTDFEEYLLHIFECHGRYPCYSWGTDASEVTLWTRKSSKDSSSEKRTLLLPCSFCGEREAVKRFRMLRYLVYCSKKCCKKDSVARHKHLLLQMVDVPETKRIDFKDERQFSVLL